MEEVECSPCEKARLEAERKKKHGEKSLTPMVCDVCIRTNKDATLKETSYCELCDANICSKCWNNYWKRGQAAFIKKILGKWDL